MSEQIVRLVGDTTTRELWDGGPTGSTGISRPLNPQGRNYSEVVFQQAKPIMDADMNLAQQVQNYIRADIMRKLLKPGVVSMTATTGVTDIKNALRINGATVHMNGWLLNLYGNNRTDLQSDIIFPPAPYSGTREDLAYVEAWFEEVGTVGSKEDDSESIYRYGGINSGTLANDLIDPVVGAEISRRIQLRWNIRTVSDVNFTSHANGVDDTVRVKARGGSSSDTNYTFGLVGDGLFRAGDGTTQSCANLHCVDGYVYALPLFRVHRRNQTAYSSDNKDGAGAYGTGGANPKGEYHDVIESEDITPIYPVASAYEQENDQQSDKAVLKELFAALHQQAAELETWKNQRIQQGTATIYNKFVVFGGIVNAISGTRNVKITRTGTYDAKNYSLLYVDGHFASIYDMQDSVAAVPANSGSAPIDYYAYVDGTDDKYTVKVADSVPDGKLGLYRITVPASDTAANLNAVKFTDIRRVESRYRNLYGTIPSVTVRLPYAAIGSAYDVNVSIESTAYNRDTALEVVNKGPAGFTIRSHGEADNIVVCWTMTQPNA